MERSTFTLDLGAIRRNVATLSSAAGGAELWAVVKAEGYGHGAVDVGRAALDAGATALCVATLPEALHLRAALRNARKNKALAENSRNLSPRPFALLQ